MHDPVRCGAALTAGGLIVVTSTSSGGSTGGGTAEAAAEAAAASAALIASSSLQSKVLGNGICNTAANVRACGWDCGDCCRGSCLSQAERAGAGLDVVRACLPGADAYADTCTDPRFAPAPPGPARLTSGVAPVCAPCDNATTVCDMLNQTFPKPRQGFWINPAAGPYTSPILVLLPPFGLTLALSVGRVGWSWVVFL